MIPLSLSYLKQSAYNSYYTHDFEKCNRVLSLERTLTLITVKTRHAMVHIKIHGMSYLIIKRNYLAKTGSWKA